MSVIMKRCFHCGAELEIDRKAANFCEYFEFRESGRGGEKKKEDARQKWDSLFKPKK
jgi:hypothetical protein